MGQPAEPFLKFGIYHVDAQDWYDDEIIDLLDQTRWGTKETVYEHLHTRDRLKYIKDYVFYLAKKDKELIAAVTYIRRQVRINGQTHNSQYTRYLSSTPQYRGQGSVARAALLTMGRIRKLEVLPTIYYICVESKNKRSFNLVSKIGYQPIAEVKTLGMSRFFPKKSKRVQQAKTDEQRQSVLEALQDQYGDYSLYQEDHIFQKDDYYYIEKDGEIIVGAQVHEAHWRVHQLPGKVGNFFVKHASKIPLVRKIFNPQDHKFIAFEGIICCEGHIREFQILLNHLLSTFEVHTALAWFDDKCPLYGYIANNIDAGLVNKFVQDTSTYIMACTKNTPVETDQDLQDSVKYVCAYDFI